MGYNSLAITDHGNISGTYEFYKEAKKVGIKPILGMEAYYTVNHRSLKLPDDLGNSRPNYHMILLAMNQDGFHNLIKLSSLAYLEGFYFSPRIDDELLGQYNSNIIATSSCLGSRLSQLILKGEKQAALKILEYHADIFKHRYFLELQAHAEEEQIAVNNTLLDFSKILNIPIIMTADSHYLSFDDKTLHDKFLCISTNSKIKDPNRFSFKNLDCHLANPENMYKKASIFGIPNEALSNTVAISEMIKDNYFDNKINHYPKFNKLPDKVDAFTYLNYLVKTIYVERFGPPNDEVKERINTELKAIKVMGFSDYILMRWDTVKTAEENKILVGPGRGSAAGSLVCYTLGITKINPLKYGLLFQRFINEGRAATPKIFDDNITIEEI